MTPNPNSPQFLIHEVPDYACDNSKLLSSYYSRLVEDIRHGKWQGISISDIALTYNTYDGCIEVNIVFRDRNNHAHYFIMQLVPDNGFGDTDDDSFRLIYLFDGKFDENALSIRSFAKYLSIYLEFEGFEPTLIKCDKGLSIPLPVKYAYEEICKLIDITQSHIKPLLWFYTKEVCINTFEEVCYYIAGIKSRLQLESVKGKWHNVKPECFKIVKFEAEREISLVLTYIVDDVWELSLSADIADCDGYYDMFATFCCHPNGNLSAGIKKQLDALFADFLPTLKLSQGNIYVGCGCREDHSINIQYFYIEDTFDILCSMLDEIVPTLEKSNFQLPLKHLNLTGEIEAIKEKMEAALNTTLEVITEEEQINKKLKTGYFLH